MEQDGVGMKHPTEAAQKQRDVQSGSGRNAYDVRTPKRIRKPKHPKSGRQWKPLYDKIEEKRSRCFDCSAVVHRFLCEDCEHQREAGERFLRYYATWNKQRLPGETMGQWLVRRQEEMGQEIEVGKGEGDEKKGREGREERKGRGGEGEGEGGT